MSKIKYTSWWTSEFDNLAQKFSYNQCAMWCWENQTSLKMSAMNMQSKGQPFKSQVFYTLYWAHNSGSKRLMKCKQNVQWRLCGAVCTVNTGLQENTWTAMRYRKLQGKHFKNMWSMPTLSHLCKNNNQGEQSHTGKQQTHTPTHTHAHPCTRVCTYTHCNLPVKNAGYMLHSITWIKKFYMHLRTT